MHIDSGGFNSLCSHCMVDLVFLILILPYRASVQTNFLKKPNTHKSMCSTDSIGLHAIKISIYSSYPIFHPYLIYWFQLLLISHED